MNLLIPWIRLPVVQVDYVLYSFTHKFVPGRVLKLAQIAPLRCALSERATVLPRRNNASQHRGEMGILLQCRAAPMQVGCERIYLITRPVQPQCRAVADRYVYRSSRAASARQNVANDKQANNDNTLYGKVYDRRIKHKKTAVQV